MLWLTTRWVIRRALHKSTNPASELRKIGQRYQSSHNVLFFGSDHFSLPSLRTLFEYSLQNNKNSQDSSRAVVGNLALVTSTKGTANAVQKFAKQSGIPVYDWPITNPQELCSPFDIGIVVSFGHLIPEAIISAFPLGMINVHASLLPKWRGAAPIIYAILNGDETTGVSIMKIRPKHFDIGEVLAQHEVPITPDMLMPDLHKVLSGHGASLLLDSVRQLPESLDRATPQKACDVQYAPKVTPSLAEIDWSQMSAAQVYNRYRALFSYMRLNTSWQGVQVKLVELRLACDAKEQTSSGVDRRKAPGTIEYDRTDKLIRVLCADRKWIVVHRLSVAGKRIMSAADFYNGFMQKSTPGWTPCFA